jgi:hypothetical protein
MDTLGSLTTLVTFAGGVNWTVGFLTTVAIFAIVAREHTRLGVRVGLDDHHDSHVACPFRL